MAPNMRERDGKNGGLENVGNDAPRPVMNGEPTLRVSRRGGEEKHTYPSLNA